MRVSGAKLREKVDALVEAVSYVPLLAVALLAFLVPLFSARVSFIPVVVGEILAGILLGRTGLNLVHTDAILAFLSDFGLAYLMFLSGLELDFSQLIPARTSAGHRVGRVGLSQPLVVPVLAFLGTLAAGLAASHFLVRSGLLEDPWLAGFIFATTSLGVVLPLLKERNLTGTPYGQAMLAYASIADFVTMVLITAWAAIRGGSGSRDLLYLALFMVFISQVYRGGTAFTRLPVVRRLLSAATGHFDVRAAMALVLVFIAFAQQLGVESILGAFMAGATISLLSGREGEHLRLKLDAIGFGFFVPIFFIMFGANLDLRAAIMSGQTWRLLPLLLGFAFLVKVLPVLLFRTRFGFRDTLAGGFLVSAQLSLTIAATDIARRLGVFAEETVSAFLIMAILTSILAPIVFNRLARARVEKREGVVVVGDSRFAIALARRLASALPVTLILDVTFSGDAGGEGWRTLRGTGNPHEDLRAAGAGGARAVLAVGGNASRNIEVARLARSDFGVENVIATGEPSLAADAAVHGVRLVTPELSTMLLLTAATLAPGSVELLTGEEGMHIEEVELGNPDYDGRALRTCFLPAGILVLRIQRGPDRIVAHGDTVLRRGDRVMVMGSPADIDKVRDMLEKAG